MDAFYASVEQRDRPEARGRPVIVGADPRGRGVVSAASYEARRFGVHSAMPISRAFRLCPEGVFLPVDMDKYAAVSREIMAVLADFTPLVEPLSIDEAFLDVTASRALHGDGAAIAREMKERIRASVSLTASVGVAPNKFLAKVASELRKPDGLVVVEPGREALLRATLRGQSERVGRELRAEGYAGRTVTLKLRFADFSTITRAHTDDPTQDGLAIYRRVESLFDRVRLRQAVRLIGLSVSGLGPAGAGQLSLL